MADRFSLIVELTALSKQSAQNGDDRSAVLLEEAARMLFADQGVDRRREWDRNRKREQKRNPVESGGIGRNPVPPLEGFPAPLPKTPDNNTATPPAREATRDATSEADPIDAVDAEYAAAVEQLQTLVAQRMGSEYADADAFVRRRPYVTWKGWLKEILTQLTGAQTTVADVAQTCRDDETLDRPIGSPKGFRIFIASAVRERLQNQSNALSGGGPSRPPARGGERPSIGKRAFDTALAAIEEMP